MKIMKSTSHRVLLLLAGVLAVEIGRTASVGSSSSTSAASSSAAASSSSSAATSAARASCAG